MAHARIIFHLPRSVLLGAEPLRPYYKSLREGLMARGAGVEFVVHDRETLLDEVAQDRDFHIVDHGAQRHPRILNTGIAYVFPFWHLDPWGIRAASSIAAMSFDPAAVDPVAANEFHARLQARLIGKRSSRYPQPQDVAEFPPDCIAVFLQSEAHRGVEETCYLDRTAMLDAVLARDDPRPIVVKIHPRDPSAETRDWLAGLGARDARVIVTQANIHDILGAASVTVTINSAVGLESMIHGVPVVLCGQSDFHHCAETVREPDGMADALRRAEATDWPFARYLHWYFRGNCLAVGSPTLIEDFLARVAATGFELARLRHGAD